MKTLASRSRIICTVGSLVLSAAPGLLAADVVLQKVPALSAEQVAAYPMNLARLDLGATVQRLDAKAADVTSFESVLLNGDPAATYALPLGNTTLLVALPSIENIASISLLNQGAKGTVSVAIANAKLQADSPQWHNAFERDLSAAVIDAKIGPAEAKYVRLTFNVTAAGRVSGLGVFGQLQASAASGQPSADDKAASFGFISYSPAAMQTRARALYVSSGADLKEAHKMTDDQAATSYSFAAGDGSPTTVIDLGTSRTLRRLSAVYSPRAGSMSFYVMSALPGDAANSAADSMALNDATLSGMQAVASATDDGSQGRASVDFPSITGRYVMVKWTPAAQQEGSFTVAEIAALGPQGRTLVASNTKEGGNRSQTTDGKTVLDGKTMIEAKDMPGEGPEEVPQSPAEGPPPSLPQPPPFTFVPVIVPQLVPVS